ncbi:MAG TPA: hypothetical protein VHW67_04260 [Solirubrobacteraceae bacterium]|jgi:hypothetical protein|nr:hypothetical protein [Solirubrobacteraceae bacterium]
MDVWEYFQTRDREISECSMRVADPGSPYAEEEDNDQRGMIFGTLAFDGYDPESVYLSVHEVLVVRGSGIHRLRYAYFLVIDKEEIGGYERHATHDPPVHRHCSGRSPHEASPSKTVSFKEAVREAWQYVAEFATPEGVGAHADDEGLD